MTQRIALLVAPRYANNPSLPLLEGTPLLRQRLAEVLKAYGHYDNIVMNLADETVTRGDLRSAAQKFFRQKGELLFYFYGHGVLRQDEGVLATSDSELHDEGVAMKEIVELANNSVASEVILIFDCCHAGAAVPATSTSIPHNLRPDKGRVLIAACAEHEQGWEIPVTESRKLGALSTHILEGLHGAARNRRDEVTAATLGQYVVDSFRSWQQHPVWIAGGTSDSLCKMTWGFELDGNAQAMTNISPIRETPVASESLTRSYNGMHPSELVRRITILLTLTFTCILLLITWHFSFPSIGFETRYFALASLCVAIVLLSLIAHKYHTAIGHRILRRQYEHDYREWVQGQYQYLDLKGSTLSKYSYVLMEVYTELLLAIQNPAKISPSAISSISELKRDGEQSVWKYLESQELGGTHFVVMGAAGTGKSTLLKSIALTLADTNRGRQHRRSRMFLPFLIRLHAHVKEIHSNQTLAEIIFEDYDATKRITFVWFHDMINQSRCLVMLDGLDEIRGMTDRAKAAKWIEQQIKRYPLCRFIVSSRPVNYESNPIAGVTVLQIMPFSRMQAKEFIKKWDEANDRRNILKRSQANTVRSANFANGVWEAIHNSDVLNELAVNPLLLTMIVVIHNEIAVLPKSRGDLYSSIIDAFLGKRKIEEGISPEFGVHSQRKALAELAYFMMDAMCVEATSEQVEFAIGKTVACFVNGTSSVEFLNHVSSFSGLILTRKGQRYSFIHYSLQEYLAAEYACNNALESKIASRLDDYDWHETIRIYVSLMFEKSNPVPIIMRNLRSDSMSVPKLVLVTMIMEDHDGERGFELAGLEDLQKTLTAGMDSDVTSVRNVVAESMIRTRLRRMMAIDSNLFADHSLITNIEYQFFIDAMTASGEYRQPDHWHDCRFPKGQGKDSVLGVRFSDAMAFSQWITNLTLQGSLSRQQCRLPRKGELDGIEVVEQLDNARLTSIAYWVTSDKKYHDLEYVGTVEFNGYEWLDAQLSRDLSLYDKVKKPKTQAISDPQVGPHYNDIEARHLAQASALSALHGDKNLFYRLAVNPSVLNRPQPDSDRDAKQVYKIESVTMLLEKERDCIQSLCSDMNRMDMGIRMSSRNVDVEIGEYELDFGLKELRKLLKDQQNLKRRVSVISDKLRHISSEEKEIQADICTKRFCR